MHIPIRVGLSPTLKIRGLLADADIRQGQILERCPVILVDIQQEEALHQTVLKRYYYEWNARHHAVVLGYGSLYNHSHAPNVRYGFGYRNEQLVFTALRNIAAGEELFVNYNGSGSEASDPVAGHFVDHDPHRRRK